MQGNQNAKTAIRVIIPPILATATDHIPTAGLKRLAETDFLVHCHCRTVFRFAATAGGGGGGGIDAAADVPVGHCLCFCLWVWRRRFLTAGPGNGFQVVIRVEICCDRINLLDHVIPLIGGWSPSYVTRGIPVKITDAANKLGPIHRASIIGENNIGGTSFLGECRLIEMCLLLEIVGTFLGRAIIVKSFELGFRMKERLVCFIYTVFGQHCCK